MILLGLGRCDLSLLLLGAAAILVRPFRSLLLDNQPLCVPFSLVQDEVCVLPWGQIFALIVNEISLVECLAFLGWSSKRRPLMFWDCLWGDSWVGMGSFSELLEGVGVSLLVGEFSWVSIGRLPLRSGANRPRPEKSISALGNVLFHC